MSSLPPFGHVPDCVRFVRNPKDMFSEASLISFMLFCHKQASDDQIRKAVCNYWAASHENLYSGFLTRSDTNWAVHPQKMVKGLKFWT